MRSINVGCNGLFGASLKALSAVGAGYLRPGDPTSDGPDFAAGEFRVLQPKEIRSAVMESVHLAEEVTGYGSPYGLGPLREAVLNHLGLERTGRDVLVTAGGKEAFWIALQSVAADHGTLNGHRVVALVPTPGWQPYRIVSQALGIKVISYDPSEIVRDQRAFLQYKEFAPDLVVLNFPNNPTGAQLTQRQLDTAVETCRVMGASILSDEVYRVLGNGSTLARCALMDSHDFIVESASKWLAAAGLRVGFLAGGNDNVGRAAAFRATYASGVCSVSQRMALALIEDDVCAGWLARLRDNLEATRNALCLALKQLGLDVSSAGAFYLWVTGTPNVDLGEGPTAALADGAGFGDGRHVRVCCAREVGDVQEAARAIARALSERFDV